MGLVPKIVSGVGVFNSEFIRAFFQKAGNVKVEKKQLHMDVEAK